MIQLIKPALISAANQPFFPLLRGLVQSIHDRGWAEKVDLCVIDVGLDAAQRSELAPLVKEIADGRWDLDFPAIAKTPRWLQAMVARPHLPAYFPGRDIYAWIDADAWVADERALELLFACAQKDGLALVPEIHPAYQSCGQNADPQVSRNLYLCYSTAWDDATAQAVAHLPVLNSGVFAMRGDHPCWAIWSKYLGKALQKKVHALTEQCALNIALRCGNIPFVSLPPWCNWICSQATPRYNIERKRFEEPIPPHGRLSIVHAADRKNSAIRVYNPTGGSSDIPFNYMALRRAGLL